MKCLVLLAALASSALAAVTVTCPQPTTKKDFELKRYLGKWLEAKIIRRPFERGACGTAEYTVDSSQTTGTVLVLNNQYVQSAGQYQPVQLTATPADPSDPGSAKFTVNLGGKTGPTADYWVIDTDYDNFAVVYSCASSFPSVTMWILQREGAGADFLTKAMTAIDVAGLSLYKDALEIVEHNCPPTTCPATGPMSCEKHMSKLDASKMAGRWWEIQHSLYASLSDQQSCSYADFSATSTGIQIISNSLSTLDSSKELQTTIKAVWANPQDTGLFNITEGLATKGGSFFCVLDTDYDNYAVVSACGASASGSQEGSTTPTAAREGGVYVWSRKQRLESDYQLKANKALTTAGILATTMQMSLDSPCSKDALKPTPAGAATATASFLGVAMTLVLAALSSQ